MMQSQQRGEVGGKSGMIGGMANAYAGAGMQRITKNNGLR